MVFNDDLIHDLKTVSNRGLIHIIDNIFHLIKREVFKLCSLYYTSIDTVSISTNFIYIVHKTNNYCS